MFDYQKMADVYRELALAYDKINSFTKQGELLESINKERYQTLEEQYKISIDSNQSLLNLLKDKDLEIDLLNEEVTSLNAKLDYYEQEEDKNIGIYD